MEVAKLKNSQKYGTIRLNQRDKLEVNIPRQSRGL
nr:hypothetical protein [uncultured bacterium]